MPIPAIVAGAGAIGGAIGVGEVAKKIYSGVPGNNDFQASDYQRTGDYDPNAYAYGGWAGGASEAANRYAGQSDAYNRGAGQAFGDASYALGGAQNSFADAGYDRQAAYGARAEQANALGLMRSRAMGTDLISQRVAQLQSAQMQNQTASMGASARGPGALALAQQNAMGANAYGQASIANQAMIAGAQEQLANQNAYFSGASGMRQGDIGQMGATTGLGSAQTGLGNAYTGLGGTQGGLGLGYSGLEHNVQAGQLNARMGQQGMMAGQHTVGQNNSAQVSQGNANNSAGLFKMALGGANGAAQAGMSGGGGGGGGGAPAGGGGGGAGGGGSTESFSSTPSGDGSYLSDVRVKTGVASLGGGAEGDYVSSPGGDMKLRGGGLDVMGSLGAINSHITANQNSTPFHGMMSDPRAKEDAHHVAASDPTTRALAAGLSPYSYEYKPGMGPRGPQVGPMAQNMLATPMTSVAVKQDPQSGLLTLDRDGLAKLTAAGVGHLAQRQEKIEAALAHHGLMRSAA